MKEDFFYQWSLLGGIGLTFAGVTTVLCLARQFITTDPRRKIEQDKILLKELLEGFGLEIPAELEESEGTVVKSLD